MHWRCNIEVLTPLFNRGAYQDTPELRVPSIRGMVRWWFRANRAGGNVWPADGIAPATPAALRARLNELGCLWPVMLAGPEAGSTLDQLRAAATDTVDGMPQVFGQVRGGRMASTVKFKIVRLEGHLRLLVFAPGQRILDEARRALQGRRSRPETWQLL